MGDMIQARKWLGVFVIIWSFACLFNEILYIKSKSGKIIIQKYFANSYWNDMFTYIKNDEE